MLIPRKLKHKKHFRAKVKGMVSRGDQLAFGKYGLKAETGGLLSSRQIEAARRAITRYIKRGGKVWIRIFPDRVVTRTSPETGMGGGKGSPDHFVARVLPGRIIFELEGVAPNVAQEAIRLASHKLSIKSRFIEKKAESPDLSRAKSREQGRRKTKTKG